MNTLISAFAVPAFLTVLSLGAVWYLLGATAFFIALLLVVLEVTLSFDNAVVNAKVLAGMPPVWQKRFLTWGILIAVFLTRAVLPILIVAVSIMSSPWLVTKMAFESPQEYAHLLKGAKYAIYSFGGIFLLLVSLKYFFDERKERHWIRVVEQYLSKWGRIEAIEIFVALIVLAVSAYLVPTQSSAILFAGVIGLALFILVQGLASMFSVKSSTVAHSGLASFIYLNILDAAFSLDSVVGAFALTTQIAVITVGLGIGAYFVRALTIYMVRHGTLHNLIYIENGAHWAILGLALAMFAGLFVDVPEPITGLVGLLFVGFAYWSSVRFAHGAESTVK
ncbi:DUF475 domain-containing protein [bacterium]|nr:DUF475 domain-containing protein [bacterium]